jgi:VWFA-related protein
MQHRAKWALRAAVACALAGAGTAPRAQQAALRAPAIDLSVLDADGRPVTDLGLGQFTVTVDGAPRGVRSARYVYRGPGAEAAARSTDPAKAPLFEPRRMILVVVDETSFPRGSEKTVVQAADRLLDRFGAADHVALVTIPLPADSLSVSFGDDRSSIRDTLARIVGRGAPANLLADANDARFDTLTAAAASYAAASASGAEAGTAARPMQESRLEAAPAKEPDSGPARDDRTLDVATHLLAGLAVVPGPKTVILVTGGLADADRPAATAFGPQLQAVEAAAVKSRSVFYVVGLPGLGRSEGWGDLEQLSLATGGSFIRAGRNVDQALDRVGLSLSGLYCLELEPAAADGDGKPHAIRVTVARPSVTVRVARRLVPRDDPPFFAVTPLPPPATVSGDLSDERPSAAARHASASRRAPESDPELDTIVARAAEYISGYFREFRNVVAEEDYTQTVLAVRPAETREMKSDFLLVTAADGNTWVPFRDVFEVDGHAIRDRDDRLRKLFLESPPGTAFEAMARVQDEGARYNLAWLGKTDINVPTFALTILLDRNIRSFTFKRGREETVEGDRLLRVDFEEHSTPTLVTGTDAGDVPSAGSFWIEPLTGRVVKTFLRAARNTGPASLAGLTFEATVTYRRSDTLGLWVPAEMRETYRLRGNTVEGRALYSKFRSFQVRTEQEIKVR